METLVMNQIPGASITDRMFEIIAHAPGCQIRHVAHLLPDLSLREVFNALRYLSSNGQLHLKVDGHQGVTISVAPRSFN
jgi:hypothetical protein